jgi:hypothetical protein
MDWQSQSLVFSAQNVRKNASLGEPRPISWKVESNFCEYVGAKPHLVQPFQPLFKRL